MNTTITDEEVYTLALKIARKEFQHHHLIYRCEVEDLASELYAFYRVHIHSRLNEYKAKAIEASMTLEQYLVNALCFELNNIRRREAKFSSRFIIESEILDGRFQANNYFELLESAGKVNLWNDSEIIIDTQEKKHHTPSRNCSCEIDNERFLPIEKNDLWLTLKANLKERDFQVVYAIFYDGKTEREVANEYGISQQAVNKIIKKLTKLQKQFEDWR